MSATLTTITPFWGRPDMLRKWAKALESAHVPGQTVHILFCVGESLPDCARVPYIHSYFCQEAPGLSIGHYHNLGAELANTPWIMKLDLDALPHAGFFRALLPLLGSAAPRQWFNTGMVYLNAAASARYLALDAFPVLEESHGEILRNLSACSSAAYKLPQATNWICRKADYQRMGGCDEHFRGYGWEDYQQIYGLEYQERGMDPLPGSVTLDNVTHRCRDEIARPKALAVFSKDSRLCLLHHWHPQEHASRYRSSMDRNREVLLRFVQLCKVRDSKRDLCSVLVQA